MLDEKRIYVKLYLGEQDGYFDEVQTQNGLWPDRLYIHALKDTPRVAEAERVHADDPEAIQAVKDSLAVLCYEFTKADPKEHVTGGKQYTYTRCPAHDRAVADPAV